VNLARIAVVVLALLAGARVTQPAEIVRAAASVSKNSSMADAAERGDWARVKSLAASKAGVNDAQPDGMRALHWAVQANREDIAELLLKAGADANAANRYGIAPLWLAATNGSAAMEQLLLKRGANAKAALPHGETALMAAARTGEPESVQVLLKAGADPNAFETGNGETALMWAAAENHGEAIRVLMAAGANANAHAKELKLAPMDWMQVGMVSTVLPRGGFTALMYAARQDAQDAARALAEGGANLNERDPDGTTALEFAIINQHCDLAALLLEKGADPNVADNSGMNALYAAVDMVGFRGEIGRPGRALPDQLGALDVVRLALKKGADPKAGLKKVVIARHHGFGDSSLGPGATPLMRAAKTADLDVMKILIEAGADVNRKMVNGGTAALILAAARPAAGSADKYVDAMRLLAENGANLNVNNARGDRPLIVAARQGTNVLVKALVELGADLDAADGAGKTALALVSEPGRNRHEDTEKLLLELGAKRP
jgi:ankyrin repeat protein